MPDNTNILEKESSTLTPAHLEHPDVFKHHLARWDGAPAWLHDLKEEQWTTFQKLPMPRRKDEMWRFASVDKLSFSGYQIPNSVDPAHVSEIRKASNHIDPLAGRAIFADDQPVGEIELAPKLADKGVIWATLADAVTRCPDLLQEHFLKYASNLGAEKFAALHAALMSNGLFLYVPRNVEIDAPFVSYHWTVADGSAIFPHTLIVAEDNAKVNLIEFQRSYRSDTSHYVGAKASVISGPGANVSHKVVQNWNLNTLAFQLNASTADRDAQAKNICINTGSRQVRNESHTRIIGAGANVEMYSLNVPTGTQEIDQRTLQTHSAPRSRSDLLYKNALSDESRTIFSGLIRVDPDAQQTDAYQTNNNLLLDSRADANSLPGLEIEANDVKCSHGATTGQIDETNLFYLLSRGIPRRKAQELLVFGFFEEIIEKFDNDAAAEMVREIVQSKFAD